MDFIEDLMLALSRINYKKREKNWENFFKTLEMRQQNSTSSLDFSLDELASGYVEASTTKLTKRKKRTVGRNPMIKKENKTEEDQDSVSESSSTSQEDALSVQKITEMSTNTYSTRSRRLAATYFKENSCTRSLDECLAVIDFIESTETTFKALIFELCDMAHNHSSDTKKFRVIKEALADMFYTIRKIVEHEVLQLYIHYITWLWERKTRKKERSMLLDDTN